MGVHHLSRRTIAIAAIAASVGVVLPIAGASPAAAEPVTFTPNNGVPATWTVPEGVFQVELEVVGGKGASGGRVGSTGAQAAGGFGAVIEATMPVVPGQVLWLVVGEGGGQGGSPNGGGPGEGTASGGRGGGASTVRACADCSDEDGLVVAGGGGGGGGRGELGPNPSAGAGAHADQAQGGVGFSGSVFVTGAAGGTSGTATGPGAGGASGEPHGGLNPDGANGSGSSGGRGGNGWSGAGGGGGGGGGYFGGGGGGGGGTDNPSTEINGGGGGGGAGSSVVLGATQIGTIARDTANAPHITITPVEGPPPASPTVVIDRAPGQADLSWLDPIRFSVEFSEPVTGFEAEDVQLTTTTGAQVTGIVDEGDGRYTVEVSSFDRVGPVTIAIPAAVVRSAADLPNLASTAIDDTISHTVRPPVATDVDGDGDVDRLLYRKTTGEWVGEHLPLVQWGLPTDLPVPGDYDGSGGVEIVVFRSGRWYFAGSSEPVQFGTAGDLPVPAQWDVDDGVDLAVFRPSSGRWYVEGQAEARQWGAAGDVPVPADYDGDGENDRAVFRPSSGRWYVEDVPGSVAWGTTGDVPVPADYDGDGDTDIAVFRPSTGRWYVHGADASIPWGASADVPVPGDWDEDGDADVAVFRPSSGRWYVFGEVVDTVALGRSGDTPLLLAPAIRARYFG